MELNGATVEATPHARCRQDRREPVDPPLQPHCSNGQADQLCAWRPGKIGVLIDLGVVGDEQLGKDLAMHIAASIAQVAGMPAVSIPKLLETERRIAIEKAREAGKPEAMLEKIAAGTVQKYLKEVTLLGQVFVKDDKLTIEQLLKSKSASVSSFTLYIVGEGIEKKKSDFAAEVAAQAAAAAK